MCDTVERDYSTAPQGQYTSPSFDPNNLTTKAAAIAALLQQVHVNARDLCGGGCSGGKNCVPVTLLKDPTGPGDLELIQEPNGKKHYLLTVSQVGTIKLYSNECRCL